MAHKYNIDYDITESVHENQVGEPYYPGLHNRRGRKWYKHFRAFQAMMAEIASAEKLKDYYLTIGEKDKADAVQVPELDVKLAKLVMPIRFGHLPDPPAGPTTVTHTVTFKADNFSLVDGQATKVVQVQGPTDPVSLATLEFPAVTIKPEHQATKKVNDAGNWKLTGAQTGNKTEVQIKALSINGNLTVTVITAAK